MKYNLEKKIVITEEEQQQHEVDIFLRRINEDFLRMFPFHWYDEAFFYILMTATLILSWWGWIYLIDKHISFTPQGLAVYVGCGAGAIFSLLNLIQYIKQQQRNWATKRETEKQLAITNKRIANFYEKVKIVERTKKK